MPATSNNNSFLNRSGSYVTRYPSEFTLDHKKQLYCTLCKKNVSCNKDQNAQRHRESKTHSMREANNSASSESHQTFIEPSKHDEEEELASVFLAAEIPLKKLRNTKFSNFLNKHMGWRPSESSIRRKIPNIAKLEKDKIK
eukprot:GAHX01001877.1.p1 GENE.GAHX01001877.1~~GAHX01001877.1.p1  ORF type:complete len:141 (-),score=26.99 GAHX01001877.1:85-507(-)